MEQLPSLAFLGKRSVGGRVAFRTNSKKVTVTLRLETLGADMCIPLVGSAGADLYVGRGREAMFMGSVFPATYEGSAKTVEKTFELSSQWKDIACFGITMK